MKRLALVFAVLAGLLLAGCVGNPLVGRWQWQVNLGVANGDAVTEYKADGTYSTTVTFPRGVSYTETGSWKEAEKSLTTTRTGLTFTGDDSGFLKGAYERLIPAENTSTITSLEGNTLVLETRLGSVTMTRKTQ